MRVQHNPKSSNCQGASRRSDGYAWKTAGNTPGDLSGAPQGEGKSQGEPISGQKSAEGIVVEGNEPGGGDAPCKRRDRRTHRDEGLNGGQTEWFAECKDK